MINGKAMQTMCFSGKIRINLLIGLILVALSACTYEGGGDQPVIRKFTWFSFVAGDDIAQQCHSLQGGKPKGERYRLVYNGVYNEQVRSYDITPAEKGRYQIKIHVMEEASLTSVTLDQTNPDLFKPWRPKVSVTNLSASDIRILKKTLTNAGFFDSPPPSENLPSIGFYWVVSACIDGKFSQNAYLWPDKNFTQGQFEKLLSAWDFTDIPINPPRKTSNFSVYSTNDAEDFRNHFNLRFGRNGLLRHTTIN